MAQLGLAPSSKNIWGFDPRTIGSCVLWLDGADSNTISFSSGTNVSTWTDKSGQGNTATAVASGFGSTVPPTYTASNKYVNFGGSSAMTNALSASSNVESVFVVGSVTSLASNSFLGGTASGSITTGGRQFRVSSGGTYGTLTYANGGGTTYANIAMVSPFGANVIGLLGYTVNAGAPVLYEYGSSLGTGTTPSFTTSRITVIGARGAAGSYTEALTGNIYEILIYNTLLSTTQRQIIEGYLAWKWGLQANLSVSHPFAAGIYSTNPVSTFNPTSVSGCALWMDASDSSTVTLSGSNVSSITDKSGNGLTMTATGTLPYVSNAQNGLNAIGNFAINAYLSTSSTNFDFGTGDFAIFAVARSASTSGGIYPIISKNLGFGSGAPTSNYWFLWRNNASTGSFVLSYVTSGSNTVQASTSATVSTNSWYMISGLALRSSVSAAFYNGGNVGFGAGNATTVNPGSIPIRIGASILGASSLTWGSLIGEIIVYNGTISGTQRQQIEAYLSWKWGLQGSLVSTQPYSPTLQYITRPLARQFQPVDISGCSLWLDSADMSTITLSGSSVTAWNDKSGNANNATGSAGTYPTIHTAGQNGLNTISFNGTSQFLTVPNSSTVDITTTDFGMFFVYNYVYVAGVNSTTGVVAKGVSGANYSWNIYTDLASASATGRLYVSMLATNARLTTSFSSTQFIILGLIRISGVLYYYINGALISSQVATGTLSTTNDITIGKTYTSGNPYYNSDFCEMIIYNNTTITAPLRQQIEGYLAWKWGLRSSFASTHPFYNIPTNTQTPFNPRTISGCVLWLDGADSATIQVSSGTNVSQWTDKSGSGDNAVQATAANQPTYSNNGIVFSSAASTFLSLILPSTLPSGANPTGTYFFVSRLTTGSAVQAFFMYGPTTLATGANPQFYYNASNQLVVDTFGAGGTTDGTAVLNSTVIFSSTISNTGGTGTVTGWRNSNSFGPTTYTTASITSQKGFIGVTQTGVGTSGTNAFYFNGSIYEIIFYNSVLSTSQRQQVEGYLAWKWGLNANLPTTHAFYKIRP